MSNEYPLYPTLSKEGEQEAQIIMNGFRNKLIKIAEETLSVLYVDVAEYIQSDSWGNFRNHIMDGFKDYNNRKIQAEYDFKEIRQAIYKEFKEDIDKDLNQDLLEEVAELKKRVEQMRERVMGRQ